MPDQIIHHLDDGARALMRTFAEDTKTSLVLVPFFDSRPVGGRIYLVRYTAEADCGSPPMGFTDGVQIIGSVYAPSHMKRNARGHRAWIGRNAAEIAAALAPIASVPVDTDRIFLEL